MSTVVLFYRSCSRRSTLRRFMFRSRLFYRCTRPAERQGSSWIPATVSRTSFLFMKVSLNNCTPENNIEINNVCSSDLSGHIIIHITLFAIGCKLFKNRRWKKTYIYWWLVESPQWLLSAFFPIFWEGGRTYKFCENRLYSQAVGGTKISCSQSLTPQRVTWWKFYNLIFFFFFSKRN